ncbi:hypothetical protein [Stutzerimonas stutzeri]|uniref:hypothetical protein n=1 Tax=Stutzerimonas stutzeri TaxID=316 RepID=UPI0015E2F40C|nr:hypothetical protein [Stutzerimonas stutzeri]
MVKLEGITKDAQLRGLHGDEVVKVISVDKIGDSAITAVYQKSAGGYGDQMLFRSDEACLELAQVDRAWAFDTPGGDFKLALEAWRIQLAHLFDPMMEVHTSNVDPLPHQISASTKPCCRVSAANLSSLYPRRVPRLGRRSPHL